MKFNKGWLKSSSVEQDILMEFDQIKFISWNVTKWGLYEG